ncbi:MAG: TrkA family potassium uptake protein [Thermomicrobiales bacterium]|nr:TrkA family potassium uptake protein [Thermomicrobiales bacterium]
MAKGIGVGSKVAVIGLGRFGRAAARTCHDLGYEVLAIDLDEKLVADAARFTALAVQGDGTDEDLLRSLQVHNSDVAIVAQGESLEASILSAMLLKQLGVPYVVSKAKNELHGAVLRSIGVHRVVYPERNAGEELAHSLAVPSIEDYISISSTSGVAKVPAPDWMVGQTVSEMLTSCGASVSLLLIVRGRFMISTPSFNERIESGDDLIVAGPDVEVERMMEPPDERAG